MPHKKSSFFNKKKKSKKGSRKDLQGTIINSAIVVLSLLLVAFIFSFTTKQTHNGVPIEITFPDIPEPRLAVEIYEKKPVMDIEVEILNGCGVVGLASKVSDLLRDNNIDVVRSENADNFNYTQTMLILRNENLEELNYVAKSLGLNPTEDPRVIHQPDESLSVDLTLILGKDFSSIKSIQAYIDK
jgi:hypothetical protein